MLVASRVFTFEDFPGAAVKMPRQIAIKISVDAMVVLISLRLKALDHCGDPLHNATEILLRYHKLFNMFSLRRAHSLPKDSSSVEFGLASASISSLALWIRSIITESKNFSPMSNVLRVIEQGSLCGRKFFLKSYPATVPQNFRTNSFRAWARCVFTRRILRTTAAPA